MGTQGGKREGAGRRKGSKNKRPRLSDALTPENIVDFNKHILSSYKKSDRLAIWMGEQIYGKALQAVEMSGDLNMANEVPSDKVKDLANKLDEIHQRRTGGGNRAKAGSVGTPKPD